MAHFLNDASELRGASQLCIDLLRKRYDVTSDSSTKTLIERLALTTYQTRGECLGVGTGQISEGAGVL